MNWKMKFHSEIFNPTIVLISQEIAAWLVFLVPIGFLVNIHFYLRWLSNQKPNEEVYLYMVKGKFTYFTVLDLIGRIERATNKELKLERKKIEILYNSCVERKKPFKVYRSKIYRMLKQKSFGKPRIINSISRMPLYSQIVVIWSVLIILSVLNFIVIALIDSRVSLAASIIAGSFFGLIPGVALWLFCHSVFNSFLKDATQMKLKYKSSIPFRIAMAQFWAFTGWIWWKDIYGEDVSIAYIDYEKGPYYSGFSSGWEDIESEDDSGSNFKGGGASGVW